MEKIIQSVHTRAIIKYATDNGYIRHEIFRLNPNRYCNYVLVSSDQQKDISALHQLPLSKKIKKQLIRLHNNEYLQLLCNDICRIYHFSNFFKVRFYKFLRQFARILDSDQCLVELYFSDDDLCDWCALHLVRCWSDHFQTINSYSIFM